MLHVGNPKSIDARRRQTRSTLHKPCSRMLETLLSCRGAAPPSPGQTSLCRLLPCEPLQDDAYIQLRWMQSCIGYPDSRSKDEGILVAECFQAETTMRP